MNQEIEKVFSAEELSKDPESKSIGFVGKSGRLVAVTTILTFSLVGPLAQQTLAQGINTVNTEENIVSKQSDENQFVIAVEDDGNVPIWLASVCHGNFVECTFLHKDCFAFYTSCPHVFCDPQIGE